MISSRGETRRVNLTRASRILLHSLHDLCLFFVARASFLLITRSCFRLFRSPPLYYTFLSAWKDSVPTRLTVRIPVLERETRHASIPRKGKSFLLRVICIYGTFRFSLCVLQASSIQPLLVFSLLNVDANIRL